MMRIVKEIKRLDMKLTGKERVKAHIWKCNGMYNQDTYVTVRLSINGENVCDDVYGGTKLYTTRNRAILGFEKLADKVSIIKHIRINGINFPLELDVQR